MKVLVIGSTGTQGGHVARHLLRRGHVVHAFTRKPESPAAKDLAKMGAIIISGDLNAPKTIKHAAEDVDAIFGVTSPFEAGVEGESRQGFAIVDAAKATGKYLVYSSMANARKLVSLPIFASKWTVEQHIAKTGVEAAILGPVYFMDNFVAQHMQPWLKDGLKKGLYALPVPPEKPFLQLAVDDLASFAVLALENKRHFAGKRIDLASDELTGVQVAEILSKVIGKPIKYYPVHIENVRKVSENAAKFFEWYLHEGYFVDVQALHTEYPEVSWHTYESWAKEQNWEAILSLSKAEKA